MKKTLSVVVLISGSGSNLQALIDAAGQEDYPARISAVISNREDAYGLQRARAAGIPCRVLSHQGHDDREAYDRSLMELIDVFDPGLVVLAGFMRILTEGFVNHYSGRMLNIHPSLLPKFRGLHTHQRALDAAEAEHGASVHFVTRELDGGPLIVQSRVPVLPGDTAEVLAARVLEQEHIIYPRAVKWFAEGRLKLENGVAMFDNKAITGL
ncbi:MAG: phosphoribosylglycinamide formyltransferase [Pseudomonadota bacterium]